MSNKRTFEFFSSVPQPVVHNGLKSAVSVARNTDPDLNLTYQMLAAHFGLAIMPVRPRKPKDKSKADVGGQIVTRWILAVLRHEVCHNLTQLNQKPFLKLPGCRASLFVELDAPALRALPDYHYPLPTGCTTFAACLNTGWSNNPSLTHNRLCSKISAMTLSMANTTSTKPSLIRNKPCNYALMNN